MSGDEEVPPSKKAKRDDELLSLSRREEELKSELQVIPPIPHCITLFSKQCFGVDQDKEIKLKEAIALSRRTMKQVGFARKLLFVNPPARRCYGRWRSCRSRAR